MTTPSPTPPPGLGDLHEKVLVVTGAASGIGRACAERFVAGGARVVLADRDRDAVHAVSDELGATGVAVDVTSPDDCARLATAATAVGPVDGIVTSAGVGGVPGPALELPLEDWNRIFDVNFMGTLHALRALGPHLRDGGSVTTISSMAVRRGSPSTAAYSVSKSAVWALTRVLSLELAPRAIRVNSIAPGIIDTPLAAKRVLADAERRQRAAERVPIGRLGTGTDVAELAAFLASDRGSYVTGECIAVDGGLDASTRP